jgi:hypothetical protein
MKRKIKPRFSWNASKFTQTLVPLPFPLHQNNWKIRSEHLSAEVQALQGQLIDYNFLVEKINLATVDLEPSEILKQAESMKERNDEKRRDLDKLFTERSMFARSTFFLLFLFSIDAGLFSLPTGRRAKFRRWTSKSNSSISKQPTK